ncbi:MAG TPA: tetratricopeptide repeat protein, partial [Thermogutta sp.]|nr:tetratricopeptide repeat protein [Thermogutta sp.]
EAIYRDQAKRLLSLSRKDELADIYLEFANRLFDPPNKLEEKPDYAKARQFYEKARDLGPSENLLVSILFQIARCHQLSGDWNAAIAAYRDFIQRFPQDSREIAARFHLGECLLNQGNPAEARRVWEDLLAKHQDHPSAETATAAFRLAETRGMPNPPSDEELGLGVAALRQFLERFPQDERVGQAYLIMAQGFVSREHWDDARRVLEEFLADARSEKAKERADAMFLLAEVYRQAKRFQEAIELWRKFVQQFPTHPSWNDAQAQIIETELAAAQEKFTQGDYTAARQAWETFLQLHPLDERAPKILYLFGEMNARQKLWDAAINDWRRLAEKYPDNPWGQQARFAIAQLYETQLHDAEKALEEYRKVGNPLSEAAAAAIARLTAKTLNVETPRVFRSDETPKVRLITRNIEKVSVAVYRLDPEAYFRKMHTLTGVEQ